MADMTIEDELALIQRKPAPQLPPVLASVEPPSTPPAPQPDPEDSLPPAATNLKAPPEEAGMWEVMGAAWKKGTISGDIWGYEHRQRNALAQEMFDLLPPDAQRQVNQSLQGRGSEGRFWQVVTEAAAKDMAANPDTASRWGQYPTTPEAVEARIRGEMIADRDEAQRILDLPGGGISQFIGESARAMTGPGNIIATGLGLFTGGAGTAAWRVIASEAALNAGAEGIDAYNEQQIAQDYGWEEPDIGNRMLFGAVLGGAFSGAVIGGAKLFGMAQARRASAQAAVPEGADPLAAEVAIDKAEATLRDEPTDQELATPNLGTLAGSENLPYNEGAVLRAIIGTESGGNANAKNPSSSALGLGQFIGSTWLNMIKKHRPDLAAGKTDNEILNLRTDPTLSAEMTAQYTRENAANLQRNGLTADPGSLYMSHFMGPGGAVRALQAPLDTPISALMSPKEIAANAGIRFGGKSFRDFTAGDLRRWAAHKMRSAYDPNARTDMPVFDTTSRGYTGAGQVKVGDDMTIDVGYEVVDASSLTRASGAFQPRDRSRLNSDAWIADTAARLDPAQLMPSPTADRGALIIGPDNMIESGNGRFGAILRSYERHPDRAAAYRGAIEAAGFTVPEGMERPVLVARRRTDLTNDQRIKLTIDAQDSQVGVLTPTEQAQVAARTLTPERLAKADFTLDAVAPENAAFLRSFMEAMPRSLRNAMADGDGGLNGFGRRHLREALFARAWEDPDIIELMTEGQRGDLKGLFDALENSAPAWAALKADIEAGRVAEAMDISGFVLDAMRMIAAARKIAAREKTPLAAAMADLLNSPDMIEGALAPLTTALLRKFWRNGRAAPEDEVTSFLTRYADEARQAGASGGLFDTPSPRDVLTAIDRATFGDLPEDLGAVRGFARPNDAPRAEPVASYHDAGTAAPEVEAADQSMREALDAPAEPGLTMANIDPELDSVRAEIAAARAELGEDFATQSLDLEGIGKTRMSEFLDSIDTDAADAAVLRACGINPGGAT